MASIDALAITAVSYSAVTSEGPYLAYVTAGGLMRFPYCAACCLVGHSPKIPTCRQCSTLHHEVKMQML